MSLTEEGRAHSASVDDYMPSFPPGPLDKYRHLASFDWRKMKVAIEGEDIIRFKAKVFKTLENDPLFARQPYDNITLEEHRHLCFRRMKRVFEYQFYTQEEFFQNPSCRPPVTTVSVPTIGPWLSRKSFASICL